VHIYTVTFCLQQIVCNFIYLSGCIFCKGQKKTREETFFSSFFSSSSPCCYFSLCVSLIHALRRHNRTSWDDEEDEWKYIQLFLHNFTESFL